MVKDKEKARLSLLEEKVSDALSLLLQLRNQVRDPTAPPSAQGKKDAGNDGFISHGLRAWLLF